MLNNELNIFKGRKAALLTKHGKEEVIKPLLEKALQCEVLLEESFDTDTLGTFTSEVPRPRTQLETARIKATKAMELTGLDIGIASEGSFGPDPSIPFIALNLEIVMFLDKKEKLEIIGTSTSHKTNFNKEEVRTLEEAEAFAKKAGFPSHHLIIGVEEGNSLTYIKGIDNWEGFYELVKDKLSSSKKLLMETDMRAHANPTRMENIRLATEELIKKLLEHCPKCHTPGFSVLDKKRGLACELCGLPTNEVISHIYSCQSCSFSEERIVNAGKKAYAGICQNCNP